jgi:hypothetical protein
VPDIVVGQHGYWEKSRSSREEAKNHTEKIVRKVTEYVSRQEMNSEYPRAYERSGQTDDKTISIPYKVWMTSYYNKFIGPLDPDSDGSVYDGSFLAKKLGWRVLNRSYFGVNPRTHDPEGAHPMNEVLELELEMLLLMIRNLPSR